MPACFCVAARVSAAPRPAGAAREVKALLHLAAELDRRGAWPVRRIRAFVYGVGMTQVPRRG